MKNFIFRITALLLFVVYFNTNAHAIMIPKDYYLDSSNTSKGYFTMGYEAKCGYGMVTVEKIGTNNRLRYWLPEDGTRIDIGFTMGDGKYKISITEATNNSKVLYSEEIAVSIASGNSPFVLNTSPFFVDETVERTIESLRNSNDNTYIDNVMGYCRNNISYDFERKETATLKEKYQGIKYNEDAIVLARNPGTTIKMKSGFCADKAVLAVTMLRAEGIEAKVVCGTYNGAEHAWFKAYTDERGWQHYCPTSNYNSIDDANFFNSYVECISF